MLDSGFIGHFPVGGTVPLTVQCRNDDLSVIAADGTTARCDILNSDGAVIKVVNLTTTVGSLTGLLFGKLELTSSNSFQAGSVYTVVCTYATGGTDRSSLSTFQVV